MFKQHMTILVTGGEGFIGSHVVDQLIEDGHRVVVIDHHKRDKPRFLNTNATYNQIALADPALENIFKDEQVDAVCHLAAHISVTDSVKDPVHDAQVNILDAIRLMRLAQAAGVKTFVFASSGGAIYGEQDEIPTPELMHALPKSPYGISKQMFEHYLLTQSDMRPVCLRFSNVYGPRQLVLGEGGVVAVFTRALSLGAPASIFGDGSATRDFLFVKDAVDAFIRALENPVGGVVNISTAEETSVQKLWDMLVDIHGIRVDPTFAPERPGDITRSCLENKKAKQMLGWQPQTLLFEGLKQTYDWFNTHKTSL